MSRSNARRSDWSEQGFYEPPLAKRRRLKEKAKQGKKAMVVDRSTSLASLERAAKWLKTAHAEARVLAVPQWNMDKAIRAMELAGVRGTVTNLSESKHRKVTKKR